MTFLTLILSVWTIWIISKVLSFAYLWYIKEYRFDRMWIYIKTGGIKSFTIPAFRRPPLRPKAFLLVLFSIGFLGSAYFMLPFSPIIKMIILDICSFPITGVSVLLFKLPTALYHEFIFYQAKRKLVAHEQMMVIGITGSIGKSSTKEFLATILQSKFHVLKTTGSQNAAIGVAELILRELRPEHQIFIVEMGAYKKGEIAKMARLVHPTIGIVTTINEQHLDLFGSLAHTMEAKYELIEALSGKSVAIFNADNPYTVQMAEKAQKDGKKVWIFGKEDGKFPFAQKIFQVSHVTSTIDSVSFSLSDGSQKASISVPLSGEHQLYTVTAAIVGAVASGMRLTDAAKTTGNIKPFRKTMQLINGIHGSHFVDDTFNNNPDAAKAAIQFLKKATGRKFLVFQPMIELAGYATAAHEGVGKLAGAVCDEIILTNPTYAEAFKKGVNAAGFRQPVHIFSPHKAAAFLSSHVKKGDMVLFKGKEAGRVLRFLM